MSMKTLIDRQQDNELALPPRPPISLEKEEYKEHVHTIINNKMAKLEEAIIKQEVLGTKQSKIFITRFQAMHAMCQELKATLGFRN